MHRHFSCFAACALVGCVQPPKAQPVTEPPAPPPAAAPRYPSWEEIREPPPSPPSLKGGRALIGGALLHEITASSKEGSVDLQFIRFDDRDYELRVIDQPEGDAGGSQLTDSMRRVHAAAGVNGGFFTPQFTPMGLMIADGQPTGTWQNNRLLTGAVVIRQHPRLLWNAEIRDRHARHLLQAGPRLVDAGRAVAGLERSRHTTRTFIATDGAHQWAIGLAHGVSLGGLSDILATSGTLGMHVQRALNLDGGHSSALYYRSAEGSEHSDPGWSTVRNYLAIIPR